MCFLTRVYKKPKVRKLAKLEFQTAAADVLRHVEEIDHSLVFQIVKDAVRVANHNESCWYPPRLIHAKERKNYLKG